MAIIGLDEDAFLAQLNSHLHPSSPITSNEYLYGRTVQLETIRRALASPGRQIFIHGDRGVGKTSLAQTAAYLYQSADREPIFVSCNSNTTFLQVVSAILRSATTPAVKSGSSSHSFRVGAGSGPTKLEAEYEYKNSWDASKAPTAEEFNAALAALARETSAYSEKTIVVIDEFDLIKSQDEKAYFADLIKQLADQRIPLRILFCGIGRSLEQLLGSHGSAYRYIEGVQLDRLTYGARFEIIDESARALGVKVHDHARNRIAAVSDGFPHFVHLLCQKLYWEMFADPSEVALSTNSHYEEAVRNALLSIEMYLKSSYDRATKRDSGDYERVLWAVADHSDLQRSIHSIRHSYDAICNAMEANQVESSMLVTRLNTLKSKSCGHILSTVRRSWYEFSESMMRGYVRLVAENSGCPLASEYEAGTEPKPISARAKGGSRPLVHLTHRFKKPI